MNRAETLDAVSFASSEHNENNDCAVRAVAITTGIPYCQVHKAFTQAGRKHRKGTSRRITELVVNALGFDMDRIAVRAKTGVTAERDHCLANGRILLGMTRHLAPMIDGKLYDWTNGRRKGINGAWRVTKRAAVQVAAAVAVPFKKMAQTNCQARLF